MIRYTLRCPEDHRFESWFADAGAYDRLAAAGEVACPVCGSAKIAKAPMAPSVSTGDEHPLARLRRHVEATSEDVGRDFAREARAIAGGTAPDRPIRGEATGREARALLGEGIPVLPLPFPPKRQVN